MQQIAGWSVVRDPAPEPIGWVGSSGGAKPCSWLCLGPEGQVERFVTIRKPDEALFTAVVRFIVRERSQRRREA